ncbi:MAG: hypothetical protein HY298_02695 [Verrucomicrobia bacterium]|nr:hypothetical protein [Verrucomicrobiota bacterium]
MHIRHFHFHFPRHKTGRQRQDMRTLFYTVLFALGLSALVALVIYFLG